MDNRSRTVVATGSRSFGQRARGLAADLGAVHEGVGSRMGDTLEAEETVACGQKQR